MIEEPIANWVLESNLKASSAILAHDFMTANFLSIECDVPPLKL
jgi:hypothetical protein